MLKRIARKLGVDRAIFYTASARVFQGIGGVVSVLLVATHLTGIEQGFYYTFASILAIQVFFELGLGGIITQFVAHERAHLEEQDNQLIGDPAYRSRLAYLLRFCLKWYSILGVGLLLVVSTVGLVFFSHFYKADANVVWHWPWLLMVLGTSLNFLISPFSAYLEGLGKVKQIAFIRLIQQVSSQTLLWVGLLVGLRLYVVIIPNIVLVLIFAIYAWRKFGRLLLHIFRTHIVEKVSYRTEIFPYQWKIALSWISGYFIFQLFNPVIFATEGAVAAGQMGMTLTALTAVSNLSLSWIYTKVPTFSSMIALKDYPALDSLFGRALKQSTAINIVGLVMLFLVVVLIRQYHIQINGVELGNRFIAYIPMVLMMIPTLFNQVLSSWAVYLRCHKREPMMVQSIVIAVLCVLSTLILGKYYGVLGITGGYAAIVTVALLWTYRIFRTKKREWHYE